MNNHQQQEIPHVDFPDEVSPVDQPEVEIMTPHPGPNEPGAAGAAPTTNPIGFKMK